MTFKIVAKIILLQHFIFFLLEMHFKFILNQMEFTINHFNIKILIQPFIQLHGMPVWILKFICLYLRNYFDHIKHYFNLFSNF